MFLLFFGKLWFLLIYCQHSERVRSLFVSSSLALCFVLLVHLQHNQIGMVPILQNLWFSWILDQQELCQLFLGLLLSRFLYSSQTPIKPLSFLARYLAKTSRPQNCNLSIYPCLRMLLFWLTCHRYSELCRHEILICLVLLISWIV